MLGLADENWAGDSCVDKGTLELTLEGMGRDQKDRASMEHRNARHGPYIERCLSSLVKQKTQIKNHN